MSIVEGVELLHRIPLFAKIDPTCVRLLAFTSDRGKFDPGQVVFEEGEGGDYAYVFIEGEADISVNIPSGSLSTATLKERDLARWLELTTRRLQQAVVQRQKLDDT
tara:strand:- start:776 stop:1093 length:318 start_codon:yes stop_codon:yes gene_type:complete